MIFRQLFDKKSSTYTYLIASKKGCEALIIDPVLDNVDIYIQTFHFPCQIPIACAGFY